MNVRAFKQCQGGSMNQDTGDVYQEKLNQVTYIEDLNSVGF